MVRVIIMVFLATLLPMQLYAIDFGGFNKDTQMEYFVPRPRDKPEEPPGNRLTEKILEEPPKTAAAEDSGVNWWLWGGIGLAAVAGGVLALSGGGGKSSTGGGGTTPVPTTVTGSW